MISSYQVDVENFGPIAKARVDVRPLTVFVGPSNTGKSYLAVLLYALHQCLGGAAAPYGGRFPPVRNWSFDVAASESRPFEPAVRKGLKQWASKLSTTESFPALPADVAMLIRSVLLQPRGLESQIANELSRCFGVDELDALLRRPRSGVHASIRLRFPAPAGPEEVRYDFELGAALLRRRPNQSLRQRGRRQLDPSRRGEGAAEGTGGRWYLCRQRRLGVFRWYSRAWWRVSVRINAPAARGGLRTVATAAKCHRAPVDYHPVAGQMPTGLQ